jgi:hypothetical protein
VHREATLGRVDHPDPLRLDTGRELELIVDPLADKLAKGDSILGWEGDERLALYVDRRGRTWELFRLEHDGLYRGVMRFPAEQWRGPDVVAEMIVQLIASDTRRGFDPFAAIERHQTELERAKAAEREAFYDEAADRLAHGLIKDGVD